MIRNAVGSSYKEGNVRGITRFPLNRERERETLCDDSLPFTVLILLGGNVCKSVIFDVARSL